jgi:hypothetical protein
LAVHIQGDLWIYPENKPHAKVAKAAKTRLKTPFSSAQEPPPNSEIVFPYISKPETGARNGRSRLSPLEINPEAFQSSAATSPLTEAMP